MGLFFLRLPTGFLPDEDQGVLFAQVMMPTGSTREQTQTGPERDPAYFEKKEGAAVKSCMTSPATAFPGTGQTNGMVFVMLKDWKLRDSADMRAKAIAERASKAFAGMRNALVFVFPPPPVVELGKRQGVRLRAA